MQIFIVSPIAVDVGNSSATHRNIDTLAPTCHLLPTQFMHVHATFVSGCANAPPFCQMYHRERMAPKLKNIEADANIYPHLKLYDDK
jgi:hypothetical protein